MKKKIVLIVIFILIVVTIVVYLKNNNNTKKIIKGYQMFGNDYCRGHSIPGISGQAELPWKCAICGKENISTGPPTPEICLKCNKITKRCTTCGKLLSK